MSKDIKKIRSVVEKSDAALRAGRRRKIRPLDCRMLVKLYSVSHYHREPDTDPPPVLMPPGHFCLELVTEGRGWIEIKGNWVEVTPGVLLWNGPGTETIGRSDPERPYSCLSVHFTADDRLSRIVPRLTRWNEVDEVRGFTREMVRMYADDGFDWKVLLHYIVGRLYFQAMVHEHARHDLPVELARVVELLDRDYGKNLKMRELARAAEWTAAHLHYRFKQHLGVTPHQMLLRRRIQAAREILADSNAPIKSVAAQCGFTTSTAFCVQFKKTMHMTPAKYRQRLYSKSWV